MTAGHYFTFGIAEYFTNNAHIFQTANLTVSSLFLYGALFWEQGLFILDLSTKPDRSKQIYSFVGMPNGGSRTLLPLI